MTQYEQRIAGEMAKMLQGCSSEQAQRIISILQRLVAKCSRVSLDLIEAELRK